MSHNLSKKSGKLFRRREKGDVGSELGYEEEKSMLIEKIKMSAIFSRFY